MTEYIRHGHVVTVQLSEEDRRGVMDAIAEMMLNPSFGIDPVRFAEAYNTIEVVPKLYATRLIGNEKWQAEVLLTEDGVAIGYTGRFRSVLENTQHRRVKLGYAMACVKGEDTELLPLGIEHERYVARVEYETQLRTLWSRGVITSMQRGTRSAAALPDARGLPADTNADSP